MYMKKLYIAIATPFYNDSCSYRYTVSLLQTYNLLKENNINFNTLFVGSMTTLVARNKLSNFFIENNEFTHLLFIDSDISWDPNDIIKLLKHDKDIVGGIYPKKKYNFANYEKSQNINNIFEYPLHILDKTLKFETNDNLSEVLHAPTGFLCIKKNVFEVIKKDINTYYDDEESKSFYNFFYCDIVNNNYLSEDYNFCHICRKNNIKIYIDFSINLNHEGNTLFEGNPIKHFNLKIN